MNEVQVLFPFVSSESAANQSIGNESVTSDSRAIASPRVVLAPVEQARLIDLAQAVLDASSTGPAADVAARLLEAADAAELMPAYLIPDSVVVMGSFVEFRDDADGTRRQVQLVYPKEVDIAQGRISILTPIGTALIGLQEGATIAWPLYGPRADDSRTLTVLRVDREKLRERLQQAARKKAA